MINPQHARSQSLQAHLVLETHCGFRLILYWIRLPQMRKDNEKRLPLTYSLKGL
jgi:hypothetical protein